MSSRQGGSHHHQLTCATVHPCISAPLAVLMLLAPPRTALDRASYAAAVIVSHFRAFFLFFQGVETKVLILPFSLLPILITTTISFLFACHRQRMEGLPLGAFTTFGRSRIIPLTALFLPFSFNIPQFSYQPLSLSPSTTYAAGAHPGCCSAFRLLSTTLYLPNSTYLPYPLSFPLSLSYSFVLQRLFIASGHTKMNDI